MAVIDRSSVLVVATTGCTIASNVCTATVASGHGLVAGDIVALSGTTVTTASATITSVTETTVVFPLTGANGAMADGVGVLTQITKPGNVYSPPPGHKYLTFMVGNFKDTISWRPYAIEEGSGLRYALTTARTLAAGAADLFLVNATLSKVQVDVSATGSASATYCVSVNVDE